MKYIFIHCLILVLGAQDDMYHLNKKVIEVFFENTNIICVVHNHDLNNKGIINGLKLKSVKTYNKKYVTEGNIRTECGHSIIVARDEEFLDLMLVQTREKFIFRVHSTILIFYRGASEVNMEKFRRLAIERDIEVILVKGLGLHSIFPPKERQDQLKIFSAMKNEMLMNCSSLRFTCFGNFTYTRTKWDPNFMFKKLRKEFRIAFSVYPPFIIRNGDKLFGVDVEIARLLTEDWPTHFKYIKNDGIRKKSYIHKYPTFYLNSTEADMVIGSTQFVDDKAATYPYCSQCNTFLVHRAQLYPDATFTFQHFQASLWVVFILIFVLMMLLFKFSSGIYGQQYSMVYWLVLVLGYVSTYGVPRFPPRTQTFMRLVSVWWCLISLIITTYFSAGLTSSLRMPRVHSVISTWQEMVENGIKWLDITDETVRIMNETNRNLQSLVDSFELEENYNAINEKLKQKRYALRVEKFMNNILNIIGELDEYGRENMKILENCFISNPIQFEINYNSPLFEYLNTKILHLLEAGFVDYLFKDLSHKPQSAYMNYLFMKKSPRNKMFTLRKLSGCFILLGIGYVLGFMGFVLECYMYRRRERKKENKKRKRLPRRQPFEKPNKDLLMDPKIDKRS